MKHVFGTTNIPSYKGIRSIQKCISKYHTYLSCCELSYYNLLPKLVDVPINWCGLNLKTILEENKNLKEIISYPIGIYVNNDTIFDNTNDIILQPHHKIIILSGRLFQCTSSKKIDVIKNFVVDNKDFELQICSSEYNSFVSQEYDFNSIRDISILTHVAKVLGAKSINFELGVFEGNRQEAFDRMKPIMKKIIQNIRSISSEIKIGIQVTNGICNVLGNTQEILQLIDMYPELDAIMNTKYVTNDGKEWETCHELMNLYNELYNNWNRKYSPTVYISSFQCPLQKKFGSIGGNEKVLTETIKWIEDIPIHTIFIVKSIIFDFDAMTIVNSLK